MIKYIFIIQLISLGVAFLDVALTSANSFGELSIAGKMACVIIVIGFAIEIGLGIYNAIKR